jgi:uncharacterized protein YdeI (YjbR/CyaY-like superfamily)
VLRCDSARQWKAWLASHHAKSTGVLLRIPKGRSSDLTYAAAVEAALAWGWIDGQKRPLDDTAWLQRFTPRTAKSPWSKINRQKAEALIAANDMKPPGLAEVERARADGRWDRAYDGARTSIVPDDLAIHLAENQGAQRFFDSLDGANRYAILYRIQTAKRPETRAERIARFVAMCSRHETIHPTRKKSKAAKRRAGERSS